MIAGFEASWQFFQGVFATVIPDNMKRSSRRVETWCRERAGMRVHGTTQLRPAEHFRVEELPVLAPPPTSVYDVPIYTTAKVHRDHHIEVAKALYSIPGNLIGTSVDVRADRSLVRVFSRGQLAKDIPASARAAARLTPTTCRRTRPCARCETSTSSPAWPLVTDPRSAPTPPRCWTSR